MSRLAQHARYRLRRVGLAKLIEKATSRLVDTVLFAVVFWGANAFWLLAYGVLGTGSGTCRRTSCPIRHPAMADEALARAIAGIIRHTLTAAGGALVAVGYLMLDQWTTIAGALAVIVGVV